MADQAEFEDTTSLIDTIATGVSGCVNYSLAVFLYENVEDKGQGVISKLPGLIGGIATGGLAGEALFGGALLSNDTK